ncbi:hypothetical protein AC579_8636 [Pseudocercospora musae]|uniref:BSD domain-containing protein n=1 Tax=Pseudocercospora musae TaxID=113226 RepID=A0A139IFY6_9PEZI|nr:hypothetical protein AC579_8636 [Pseudocercospora musae]
MDVAYDHIQEEALSPDEAKAASSSSSTTPQTATNLNTEFQEAFRAVSSSPWGAKLGGWFSQARKQGETFYTDLQKEATVASEQATKGFTSLREQVVQRTRGMSLNAAPGPDVQVPGEEALPLPKKGVENQAEAGGEQTKESEDKPESLPADIVKEAGSLVASLRSLGAAKLKDLQKAEDAADEALLKFGTNVRNFLRDAVTITGPENYNGSSAEVLFETQEPETGKKIFHTTRLDAQLHAIHSSASSFTDDPQGGEWDSWQESFNIEKQTDAIAKDLEKYEELRRAMEKLVPENVDYRMFWMRYYFLRKAIEAEEQKRKEVLKGAAAETEEEVAWDDDDEDESTTPNTKIGANKQASESTKTLNATSNDHLKPKEPRRSEDENKSVADSDASYDLISGTTSRATGSPKEPKKDIKDDDSDDDWE